MDRVINGLLATFVADFGLGSLTIDKQFENFCTYCVISKEYSETFDLEDVIVGGSNDLGIDGIACLVNGSLVNTKEAIDDLLETNGFLDVEFIFIQAKSASSFKGAEISDFALGVKEFFSQHPSMPRNESVERYIILQEHIFANPARMTKGNPICKLYYVTTGRWEDDRHLSARIETQKKDLLNTGLFREVYFFPVDASQLQNLYRHTLTKVSAIFNFGSRITVPTIDGVSQAFIGIVTATEYLNLISEDDGNIRKSIFYDNVRDYQDDNDVNKGIAETLKSTQRDRFIVLNNGITIVAKELRSTGDKFVIEDYQIVNGCQTSHVLFQQKANLDTKVFVPIKLIHTTDDAVTNAVIKATNSQTPVKTEDLQALSDFQKQLESYYGSAFTEPRKRLYYERRSRQFSSAPAIEKVRIVTVATQIKAFASMFLDQPHIAGRYYGTLLKSIGDRIFVKNHQLSPYYTSAYALYRLEYFLRSRSIDPIYRKFRYHLLMLFRLQQGATPVAALTANEMERYCDPLLKILWDDQECLEAFRLAVSVIDDYGQEVGLDQIRTGDFTTQVKELALKNR
jgi:hypothetical protein